MEVKMLSKRELIGYAVGSLAMTVTDAEKYWVECSENAAIHREPAADGGILLATKMPKTYRGISCLEEYRDVVVAGETNDVGFARKSQLSMPDVLGSMATEFGAAALHAKKHVTAPTEYKKNNTMVESPSPVVVVGQQAPGSALAFTQGAPSHDGRATGKRAWEEMVGAMDDWLEGCSLDGSAVKLVRARTRIKDEARKALTLHDDRTSCTYHELHDLATKKVMITDLECETLELEKKLAAFEASAKLLNDVPKKTEHWTQASAKTESQRVVQALTLFEQYSNDDFVKALAVLKKVWHAMLSERSQDRRKLGLHVRNVCGNGVLAMQGFPKSLSTFFGSNFLGIQVGMQDISLKYFHIGERGVQAGGF